MIGILRSSLPDGTNLDTGGAIAAAARHGLDGIMFNSLLDIHPMLDPGALTEAAATAKASGIRLAAGGGWISPGNATRAAPVAALADGTFEAGFVRLVAAAAKLGITELFFVVGTIADREDTACAWSQRLDAVAETIARLRPVLRDYGVRLLVKTHEEITTFEIARLIEQVGEDVLGVALDPVNLLCRIEDPVAATKRVAPNVAQVHIDDAVMRFVESGVRRYLCPLGQGMIDWRTIAALVPTASRWIELHRGQFAMPVFNPEWIEAQPDLSMRELVAVLGAAPRSGDVSVPWDQQAPEIRLDEAIRRSRELFV